MKKFASSKNRLLLLSIIFCLSSSISIVSCSDDKPGIQEKPEENTPEENTPEENNGESSQGETEQTPDKPTTYEQFEGYMFTLDQSQKPTLGAGYEAERNVPQAKLMAISHEYKFSNDILKDCGANIGLGFESKLQKAGDYFFVFSKYSYIKEDNSPSKITIIRAKDLQVEREVEYKLETDKSIDFMFAISDKKAIYGVGNNEIYNIDLENGNISLAKSMNYNRESRVEGYNGSLFIYNKTDKALEKYNSESFMLEAKLVIPGRTDEIYLLNDGYILATSKKNNTLISASNMEIVKQFNLPTNVSSKDMIYDEKGNQIFVPGKRTDKDKVYCMSLNDTDATMELFYTIPQEDIDMSSGISGNIKMGIQPDTRDLYIANITKLVIIKTPEVSRASRTGRISRISLKEDNITIPVAQADAVEKIDDMYSFSPFFYLSPSKKAEQ